jgi:hypothetical protein
MDMKLTKILQEMDTSAFSQPALSKDAIKSALNEISQYNMHGPMIRREIDLNEIASQISKTVALAEQIALTRMTEENKWFDKRTCERNMNEAKKYASELQKVAKTAQENLHQMEALYEEVGQKLNRYFDIKDVEAIANNQAPTNKSSAPIVGENSTSQLT